MGNHPSHDNDTVENGEIKSETQFPEPLDNPPFDNNHLYEGIHSEPIYEPLEDC